MKKAFVLLLSLLLFLCLAACWGENGPYDPGTPVPPDHNGLFASEHGTMRFSGDGEHVTIDFDARLAELTGLPEGEHEAGYVFLSGDLPPHGSYPVRYDTAHELRLTVGDRTSVIRMGLASDDGKTAQGGVNTVTPERIPMLFSEDGLSFTVMFQKEGAAK